MKNGWIEENDRKLGGKGGGSVALQSRVDFCGLK
jgi:hypothetical protein